MKSPFSLAGKVAVVTGANSGIGLAIAHGMAAMGASVVVAGRRQEAIDDATTAINAAGGTAIAVRYEASDEQDADALIAQTTAAFGRLDICVANAGGNPSGTALLPEMSTQMWRDTVVVNLDAVFFLFRAAAQQLIAAGNGGSLIAISSVGSIQATRAAHYAAAKAGVNGLVMNLACQLGQYAIRVNAILPGVIDTPLIRPFMESGGEAPMQMAKRIPLGRFGVPDEIAGLAVYMASDSSAFMTGQHIAVDGGMTKN